MSDIPTRANPAVDFETEAERHTAAAERQLNDASDYDDIGHALAAAQVSAALAIGAEIRAHSLRTEDALITMLDRDPDDMDTVMGRMLGPKIEPRQVDIGLVAVIGMVLFMVAAVAAAGILIGIGQGWFSLPFILGAGVALFLVERRVHQ